MSAISPRSRSTLQDWAQVSYAYAPGGELAQWPQIVTSPTPSDLPLPEGVLLQPIR